MILDTIRNGKAVSIEFRNKRVVGASVSAERAKEPYITKAKKKKSRLNGRPIGRALTWAIAVVSAIRKEHQDDHMVMRPMTCEELAELYGIILEEIGVRTCSKQNISRIEQVALGKLKRRGKLNECLEDLLTKK